MNNTSLSQSASRTRMAATRTLLSFIRTSLICLSVAFGFMQLDKDNPIDTFTIIMLSLSALFIIIGFVSYFVVLYRLKKN